MCKFDIAWVGTCTETNTIGSEYCKEHTGLKCVVCKERATNDCDETFQFVCGAPLCDNCEHTIINGSNGGTFKHSKKVEV